MPNMAVPARFSEPWTGASSMTVGACGPARAREFRRYGAGYHPNQAPIRAPGGFVHDRFPGAAIVEPGALAGHGTRAKTAPDGRKRTVAR